MILKSSSTNLKKVMLATTIIPISIRKMDDHLVRLLINRISGMANIQAQMPVLKMP
jgi:hypothetical protein